MILPFFSQTIDRFLLESVLLGIWSNLPSELISKFSSVAQILILIQLDI